MKELKEFLEKIAAENAQNEEEGFDVMDWSGGNYDDAYTMGFDDGQIDLARQILNRFL